MLDAAKNRNLTVNFGKPGRIVADGVSFDEFDGDLFGQYQSATCLQGKLFHYIRTDLYSSILFPAQLDFAKLALTNGIAENIVPKLENLVSFVHVVPALLPSPAIILFRHAL